MGESYQVPPWLHDDPELPKKIALAGFVPGSFQSQREMENTKAELIGKVRILGGEIIEGDEWDDRVTHVVAHMDPQKEGLPEKVMAAIAAGRFVVTKVT